MDATDSRLVISDEGPIIRNPWIRWGLIFGCFSLVGLYFSGQNVLRYVSRNQPIPWEIAFLSQMLYWYLWLLSTPLLLWFARRYRFGRKRWLGSLAAHLMLAFPLAPLLYSLWRFLTILLVGEQRITEGYVVPADLQANLFIGSITAFYKYWLIVAIYYTFDYYRRFKDRKHLSANLKLKAIRLKSRLTQATLEALKSQLHPHFLFNTLNTISVLMKEDVSKANSMLLRLSELLRVTLEHTGEQEVPLKKEIEILQLYLEIEKIRFSDRLSVNIDVDPAALDALVPNLIFQPLVENAIRHGIALLISGGRVEIRAKRNDSMLVLEVRDDGAGFSNEGEKETDTEGIGLANTKARLKHLYGEDHLFNLESQEGKGTVVKVEIPFKQLPNGTE